MAALLLDELVDAESIFRGIVSSQEPLFADMPIEHVEPDPKHKRHWMFATDEQKIMAHVYRPDYVVEKFEDLVVPVFSAAKGLVLDKMQRKGLAKQLVHHTFTYLLFHELFHPVHCPKSNTDKERIDVALKNGIKRAEPHLSPRDVMNKAGNVRNAVWDLLIDTFFTYYSTNGSAYSQGLKREISRRGFKIGGLPVEALPDGVVVYWDIIELADHEPETLFYPITRGMYSLLHCDSLQLRRDVFSYFRGKMGRKISDYDLEKAVVGSLAGAVKYIDDAELAGIKIDKARFTRSVVDLYSSKDNAKSNEARRYVVKVITEVNTKAELRYRSIEGIIEPLAQYISTQKEERRDGANTEGEGGEGDEQTPTSQGGGGAEDALQSLINQGDQDVEGMLQSIANDSSAPMTRRNQRLSNLAKDEHYKRDARELPIKSPTIEADKKEVGRVKRPVKVSERMVTPEELHELPMDKIMQFQQETGILCLSRRSEHQWLYEIYELREEPIIDYEYKKTGIILPDNIIIRVDGSGSMTPDGAFVGTGNRYDGLMHVVYGFAKSAAHAAKMMQKEVQVIAVSYSNPGRTIVSDAVELQTFYDTPNNSAKQVLLNPECGSTHHDIPAYQAAHARCVPGKTVEIIVTDGDLNTDHDQSMAEIRRILDKDDNLMVYFAIFNEGGFAKRVHRLAASKKNLTYKPFLSFNELQSVANEIIIQYKDCRR